MNEYIADYTYQSTEGCVTESNSRGSLLTERYLVLASYDTVSVWDIPTLTAVSTVQLQSSAPISAISSLVLEIMDVPEDARPIAEIGGHIAIGHANGLVKVVDLAGEEVASYREHRKRICKIATTRAGLIITLSLDKFAVFDMRIEQVVACIPLDYTPNAMTVIGNLLHIGSDKGAVYTYQISDLLQGITIYEIETYATRPIVEILRYPLGNGDEKLVCHPESVVGPEKTELALPGGVKISSLCSEKDLVAFRDGKGRVHMARVDKNKLVSLSTLKPGSSMRDIFLANGKLLVIHSDNCISLYHSPTKKGDLPRVSTLEGNREDLIGIAVTSRGLVGITAQECRLFGNSLFSTVLFAHPGMKCLESARERIFVGCEDGTVLIRDLQGGPGPSCDASKAPISSIDATSDCVAVASGRKVLVFEISDDVSLNLANEFDYDEDVICAKISPDARLVCASLMDSTIKVRGVHGDHLLTLYGHSMPVVSFEISDASDTIFTLGLDKLVKVWGLRHGECKKTLSPPNPLSLTLSENLVLVNTLHGLVYYHQQTFEKLKTEAYPGNFPRPAGSNMRHGLIKSDGQTAFCAREHSVSVFKAGDYGLVPEVEEEREKTRMELAEIEGRTGLTKVAEVSELEEILSTDNYLDMHREIYALLLKLTKSDLFKSIDLMNSQTKLRMIEVLRRLLAQEYNPMFIGWVFKRLIETHDHCIADSRILAEVSGVRQAIQASMGTVQANHYALLLQLLDSNKPA